MLFFRAQSTKAYTILVQVIASPTLSFLDFSIKSYNVCAVKPSYDNNMIKLSMKSRIITQDKADANFARFMTHALLPVFPEESWVLE